MDRKPGNIYINQPYQEICKRYNYWDGEENRAGQV